MRKYVVHALGSGPKTIERLLRVFPKDRMDERIDSVGLTARGVIAHLAYLEQVHLDRMRYAVMHPSSKVESVDPWERARDGAYDGKDPFHEAQVLESRRAMTVEYLEGLTSDELHCGMTTPEGEEINVLEYGLSIVAHDMEHLEALSTFLATEVATMS